ncbi:PspA/IM30 family protein [Methylobacterium sp. J-068]|uniref:PspA/IM30 family protein n=1 Tax=Methylobacterium sp. J-068 TaxID=2836649 RepID=UPI001FBA7DDA|nr:PspA/IM30 family protein [Methylobacterium sp. J-068]MCJ2033037.1 PspA/IM30 family protein [Methylobacterium sp. J-068]
MLRLFRTLARGAAARAEEDLFDRNALLILDQQIRETRAALERSRQALAASVAGDKAEARRLAEVEARAADLEARAVAALQAGRDDLAGEAAEAIAELEAERDAIRSARTRFATEVARIRAVVTDATRRQAELERGRRIAAAAETARRLRVSPAPQERATLKEAEATLARLRTLQAEADDTEAALREAEPGADIAERMEREGFGATTRPTASAVLDRLRHRAGADRHPAA